MLGFLVSTQPTAMGDRTSSLYTFQAQEIRLVGFSILERSPEQRDKVVD